MPDALTRLRIALTCGVLVLVVALTYVEGDPAALIPAFLIIVLSYGIMAAKASKSPRVVAFVSAAFAVPGLLNWHGVAGVIVSLLSAAEFALALSVLASPRKSGAPVSHHSR